MFSFALPGDLFSCFRALAGTYSPGSRPSWLVRISSSRARPLEECVEC